MLTRWSQYLSTLSETPSLVLSQFLWYNNYIKIEDALIHFEKFSNQSISFLLQLFENDRIIPWVKLRNKYKLTNDMFFQRAQLKHAIPTRWKTLISNYSNVDEKNLYQNHHVIKGARILYTEKLSSKKIYLTLISNFVNKRTSNIYPEKLFENTTLDWTKIYLLRRLATIDTTLRSFQYKILNNLLFLNKKLYTFGITNIVLCSVCKSVEEPPIHIFYMLNIFGKNYRRNFRMVLSCHYLQYRLPFLD